MLPATLLKNKNNKKPVKTTQRAQHGVTSKLIIHRANVTICNNYAELTKYTANHLEH